MSGTTVIDRRDLERLLKHLVHAEKRDDVKVDIKFYVQFSTGDEFSASTLLDPWQPFNRKAARDLVKAAIIKLDEEEKKTRELRGPKIEETVLGAHGADLAPAEAIPASGPVLGASQDIGPVEASLEGLEGAAL